MIEYDLLKNDRILIVKPDGPLAREDFENLAASIDPALDEIGGLKGLMIEASDFPGWKDFAGLVSHIKFVKNHHQRIARIAVVSEVSFVKLLPSVARHFVGAEMRRFAPDQRNDAIGWLSGEATAEASKPASMRFYQHDEPPAIWIEIKGRVSRDDYLKLLEPMKAQFAGGDPVSVLVELTDYEGLEMGAMWEDMKFGFGNVKKLRRMAIVTDKKWIEVLTRALDPLFSTEMRTFEFDQEMEAWEWVIEED